MLFLPREVFWIEYPFLFIYLESSACTAQSLYLEANSGYPDIEPPLADQYSVNAGQIFFSP
jgi:hypothetical protein